MPELPEVETIRKNLSSSLIGQTIQAVIIRESRLRWPISSTLRNDLVGQTVKTLERRGKYLLFTCTQGHIILHFGMSGTVKLVPTDTVLQKHDHIDLIFSPQLCLRYHDPRRFGCLLWTREAVEQHPLLSKLGVEPLEKEFTGHYLYRMAQGKKSTIKSLIMNNSIVVGIGNIYANEALFLAGIHPAYPAGELSLTRYHRLVKHIRATLIQAISLGGTTIRDFTDDQGRLGYFKQILRVYGRAGEPCVQCGQFIEQQRLGQRSSYFCPNCQSFV